MPYIISKSTQNVYFEMEKKLKLNKKNKQKLKSITKKLKVAKTKMPKSSILIK